MKSVALLLALGAPLAFSQQVAPARATTNLTERVQAPSYADMYCSGFITNESHGKGSYIVAGAESPNQTQFRQGDIVFLEGSGLQEGYRLSVIRELRDPNRSRAFEGQDSRHLSLGPALCGIGTAARDRDPGEDRHRSGRIQLCPDRGGRHRRAVPGKGAGRLPQKHRVGALPGIRGQPDRAHRDGQGLRLHPGHRAEGVYQRRCGQGRQGWRLFSRRPQLRSSDHERRGGAVVQGDSKARKRRSHIPRSRERNMPNCPGARWRR